MALLKCAVSKATPAKGIKYVLNKNKTACYDTLNLIEGVPYSRQFNNTAALYGKQNSYDDRKYYHFKLNFDSATNIKNGGTMTPEAALQIAKQLTAEKFPGFEAVISIHNDRPHLHAHIIVNATSFETGKAFHESPREYARCKDRAYEITVDKGYPAQNWRELVVQKRSATAQRKATMMEKIDGAINGSRSFEEFVSRLDEVGLTLSRNTENTISFMDEKDKPAIRGATLGSGYTTQAIKDRIAKGKERTSEPNAKEIRPEIPPRVTSYAAGIQQQASRARFASAKELTAALATVRTERINEAGDFGKRINVLQAKASEAKGELKVIEKKNSQYREAVKYLSAHRKYLPVYNEWQQQGTAGRKRVESKYEGELTAFKHATEQLEKMKVNSTLDPEKVKGLIREQDKKADILKVSLKTVNDRIQKLRQAEETVKQIKKAEYERGKQRGKELEI